MNWYPEENTVRDLSEAVEAAKLTWNSSPMPDDFLRAVSDAILLLPNLAPESPYMLSDWIWVSAQLRISHPDQPAAAGIALAGLTVLLKMVRSQSAESGHHTDSEFRWLTDYVVDHLTEEVGPDAFGRYLTGDEAAEVEDRLLDLAEKSEPDAPALIAHAHSVASQLAGIHHDAYKPVIAAKIEHLCELCTDSGEAGFWSRAALRYLHQEQDLIDDSLGYIGLLDDIQVVEDVYELVRGRLSWKPLIDLGVRRWPVIARSYWMDGGTANHLAPFFQSVASCVLDAAFGQVEERVLVFPETGPAGVIAGCLLGLVETAQVKGSGDAAPGTVMRFREGRHLRYALVAEPFNLGTEQLPALRLRDGAVVSVSPRIISLMEEVFEENPQLAKPAQFENWKRTVSDADLQTPTWGYRRAGERPAALVVTDRSRFLSSIDMIRPFGRPIGEMIPVAYVTRSGRSVRGPDIRTQSVSLAACNDAGTAESILRGFRDRGQQPPRAVIIDRRIQPNQLAAVRHRCRELDIKLIRLTTTDDSVLANPAESDSRDVWFLRPGEIDPVPRSMSRSVARHTGNGSLSRYLRRQVRARDVEIENIELAAPEVDEFAEAARSIQRRAHGDAESDLIVSAVLSETILRQISCAPPVPGGTCSPQFFALIDRLTEDCSVHELFDENAAMLGLAGEYLKQENNYSADKYRALCEILSDADDTVHIVVSSRNTAFSAQEHFSDAGYDNARFFAVSNLPEQMDCSMLVVPGWLGTLNMRLIQQGGWAPKLIRIFFAYEAARAQSLNRRLASERRRLRELTNESWRRMSNLHTTLGTPPDPREKDKRSGTPVAGGQNTEIDSDAPVGDEIEDGWIETLVRDRVFNQQYGREKTTEVKGHLVFFDDGEHYGIFAEGSNLICINEFAGGGLDLDDVSDNEVEKNLWKAAREICSGDILAFPDDPDFEDVIQSIADGLLRDAGSTRKSARLWKDVLIGLAREKEWDIAAVQRKLSAVGVDREAVTISGWLHHSNTIAPKDRDRDIPAILSLSSDEEAGKRAVEVIAATDKIYKARRAAARRLAMLLGAGEIMPEAGSALLEVGEVTVRYKLLSVLSIDERATFDAAVLGLHSMNDQTGNN